MKEFRCTFETEKLDVWAMCELVKYATELKCQISFSPMNVFMHIDCDRREYCYSFRSFKELYGA